MYSWISLASSFSYSLVLIPICIEKIILRFLSYCRIVFRRADYYLWSFIAWKRGAMWINAKISKPGTKATLLKWSEVKWSEVNLLNCWTLLRCLVSFSHSFSTATPVDITSSWVGMHDAYVSTETTATQSMSEEESSLMRRRVELMRERLAAQMLVKLLIQSMWWWYCLYWYCRWIIWLSSPHPCLPLIRAWWRWVIC